MNYHDIIVLSRLQKCLETPQMHKVSRDEMEKVIFVYLHSDTQQQDVTIKMVVI